MRGGGGDRAYGLKKLNRSLKKKRGGSFLFLKLCQGGKEWGKRLGDQGTRTEGEKVSPYQERATKKTQKGRGRVSGGDGNTTEGK